MAENHQSAEMPYQLKPEVDAGIDSFRNCCFGVIPLDIGCFMVVHSRDNLDRVFPRFPRPVHESQVKQEEWINLKVKGTGFQVLSLFLFLLRK